ncbi:MAG: HepT-like ribonuclease domain-containing protein [Dehalococcoidia bacterium]
MKEHRYLTYIQESIALIEARTAGGSDAFLSDQFIQDAVLWRLQTLGEATRHLSAAPKERHREIPWQRVTGFRNVAAHGYLNLSLTDSWDIIQPHLPTLKTVVEEELGSEASDYRSWLMISIGLASAAAGPATSGPSSPPESAASWRRA